MAHGYPFAPWPDEVPSVDLATLVTTIEGVGTSEAYVLIMSVLAAIGLTLGAVRSRRGWQYQVGVLFGLTSMWAAALGLFLADDAVGHDCSHADHDGEWPSLIATLAWASLLLAALAVPNPPVSRLTVRFALPILTVALIGGTVLLLLRLQPVC